ncbi:hypothetical protein DM01DRAFT_1238723 [Hesseltinella vesiculosa]|uniref:Uncharacterized protein n=1 Tax=Hesseltinella vesiculosa TaxID=101127 RepID=A0A1X2GM12_9FUNG|nr:hypothetical protein DM01DRAFT_1238723 [Hesseltinella vesiculosa]
MSAMTAEDEENLLYMPVPTYGVAQPLQSTRAMEESSSRGSSDVDDSYSTCSRVARRKQKRLERRHRPKLSSRLSNVLGVSKNNSQSDDLHRSPAEMVFPALDPTAPEVVETAHRCSDSDHWFSKNKHAHLSNIRSNYRINRMHQRWIFRSCTTSKCI